MKRSPCLVLVTLGVASAVFVGAAFGPVDPPLGAVLGTGKSIGEVEPRIAVSAASTPGDANSLFKITTRGSYYLTGNIAGVAGKYGIEIGASGVTLDLNGFDLAGVPGSLGGVSGDGASLADTVVVNGCVRNWGDKGVDLAMSTGGRVTGVRATGNTAIGIRAGTRMAVVDCVAAQNGVGINVLDFCTISGCSLYANTAAGISAGNECTVSGCTSVSSGGTSISVNAGSIVTECRVNGGAGNGIFCATNCSVRDNVVMGPLGAGVFVAGSGNRVEGNICNAAARGFEVVGPRNIIIRNFSSSNTNTVDWVIAANNVVGRTRDARNPGSPAVLGFSGPDAISLEPTGNLSH